MQASLLLQNDIFGRIHAVDSETLKQDMSVGLSKLFSMSL